MGNRSQENTEFAFASPYPLIPPFKDMILRPFGFSIILARYLLTNS
jgi:hypothetical protein